MGARALRAGGSHEGRARGREALSPYLYGIAPGGVVNRRTAASVLTACVAWALTVAPCGFDRASMLLATLCCVASLGAGIAGPLIVIRRPRLGCHLGISAFLGLATGAWLSGSHAIHPLRIDPIRGALGAFAWAVFALSWGDREPPTEGSAPGAERDAPLLLPRSTIPVASVALSGLGIVGALAYFLLAWQVRDPSRALAAQTISLACALALVNASVVVSVSRGRRR